jgi:ribosomal protein S18 acetylase RimI-like enzyme
VDGLDIIPASVPDAGDILTVQRAAYVTEAQLYGNATFSALTESLDGVRAAIDAGGVLVARLGTRIVGAVRGVLVGDECQVGRLAVAPDMQGRGIGGALLRAIEREFAGRTSRFVLYTGDRSEANLRLYRKVGYVDSRVERLSDHL